MTTAMYESKLLSKYISYNWKCIFDDKKSHFNQK